MVGILPGKAFWFALSQSLQDCLALIQGMSGNRVKASPSPRIFASRQNSLIDRNKYAIKRTIQLANVTSPLYFGGF